MKHLVPSIALVACVGCTQVVDRVDDRLEPVIRQAIAEKRVKNDRQFERWRLYVELADAAACNLSKGAIDRNATPEERAKIEALEC